MGVFEVAVEAERAQRVALEDRGLAGIEQRREQRNRSRALLRDHVPVHERGKGTLRVEEETPLIGPVEAALEQRGDQPHRLLRIHQSRAERGHLPLQHLVERPEGRVRPVRMNLEKVVRVIEPVPAAVRADRVIDVPEGGPAEPGDLRGVERFLSREPLGVDRLAVVGEGRTQSVQEALPVRVAHRPGFERRLRVAQDRVHATEPGRHLGGDPNRPVVRPAGRTFQERQVAAEISQGDHGDAVSDQGVVRVVPFRALGVDPDPAVRDEIRELGEGGYEELLQERHVVDRSVGTRDELPVRSHRAHPVFDPGGQRVVVRDGGPRVLDDGRVRLQAIGDVGVGEDLPPQELLQRAGQEPGQGLQELEEVYDLVVAPVADVAPGIVRIGDLPLDPVAGDPVRVEAVHGGGVDELRHHARQEVGVAEAQRLPVLEDVPPVALVAEDPPPVRILHVDGEAVPGAARVPMAASEPEGKVLVGQPFEGGVPGLPGGPHQVTRRDPAGERRDPAPVALRHRRVPRPEELTEIGGRDLVVPVEGSSAHDVEEHVGEVVHGRRPVAGELKAVRRRHDPHQALVGRPERDLDRLPQIPLPEQPIAEGGEFHVTLADVGGQVPARAFPRPEIHRRVDQVVSAASGQDGFAGHGVSAAKRLHRLQGQVDPGIREPGAPDGVGPEDLGGLGAVGDLGGEGEYGEPGFRIAVRPPVGVDQGTRLLVEGERRPPGEDVSQAVEEGDGHRLPAEVLQGRGPHPAELVAARPPVPEEKSQVQVQLLEHDPVPDGALVEGPLHPEPAVPSGRQGFPEDLGFTLPPHPEQGDRSGVKRPVVELVHRLVGEEASVRVHPPGGEPPPGGDEHPEVGVGGDAHEEGGHPMGTLDPGVVLPDRFPRFGGRPIRNLDDSRAHAR